MCAGSTASEALIVEAVERGALAQARHALRDVLSARGLKLTDGDLAIIEAERRLGASSGLACSGCKRGERGGSACRRAGDSNH